MQIGLGFIEGSDGKLLRHCAVTQSGDLRKDEPNPVTGFSSGAELSKDGVVSGHLGVEEALEIVLVGHWQCPCPNFLPKPPRDEKYVLATVFAKSFNLLSNSYSSLIQNSWGNLKVLI